MQVLGISGITPYDHDPSCCLMIDGVLIVAVEEERFSRKRHSVGIYPHNAILYCLKEANSCLDDIDYVCIGWNYNNPQFWYNEIDFNSISHEIFPKELFHYSKPINFKFYDHHLAHAASSFMFSNFKKSLILVMDGRGEIESTSIGFGYTDENNLKYIKFIRKYPIENSLGSMYSNTAKYLGLGKNSAGKLMGLASYGRNSYKIPIQFKRDGNYEIVFPEPLQVTDNLQINNEIQKAWFKLLKDITGDIPISNINPSIEAKNIAFSIQVVLEITSLYILNYLTNEFEDVDNLCISGGVGLNCKNNSSLFNHSNIKNIFIQPAANDAGIVLGAASLCMNENNYPIKPLENVYLGPKYCNYEIEQNLKKENLKYTLLDETKMIENAAEILNRGNVIGWFQERMEFGPRALGNRSILSTAKSKSFLKRINKIKGREHWRPLAPIVIEEDSDSYFDISVSPYMLLFSKVNENIKDKVPAIVHVDGTTRPQTVSIKQNFKLYNLLQKYKKLSGVSVLINTSFNAKGEPIVCTPKDAINTFRKSQLDYLIINNYIIRRIK